MLPRSFRCVLLSIAVLVVPLAGCTTVPPLSGPANVPLASVVARVKCDIARITAQKINQNPDYAFLKDWSIKAHMTLAVDNTSSLNPGATIIQPLQNAYPLGGAIGAVSQSTSVGIGGGLSGEAIATTDLEFFLSFNEIEADLHKLPALSTCTNPDGLLLDSDLQLDALFENALEPVRLHLLVPGNHPGTAGATPPAQPSKGVIKSAEDNVDLVVRNQIPDTQKLDLTGITASRFIMFQRNIGPARIVRKPEELSPEVIEQRKIKEFQREARQREISAQSIVKNVVEPIAQIISESFPACAKLVEQLKYKATIQAAEVSTEKLDVDGALTQTAAKNAIDPLRDNLKFLIADSKEVMHYLKTCKNKPAPKAPSSVYDPIDLISQTVNFYIIASGTVNPAWKLVRVTAPIAPALVTLNRKYTDTLIVAFGRPEPGKPVSTAVTNQILTATLRDALMGIQAR